MDREIYEAVSKFTHPRHLEEFARLHGISEHLFVRTQLKRLQEKHCERCDKTFTRKTNAKRHRQICKGKRVFCEKCGYATFSTQLLEHMASCFTCDKCKTKFQHQEALEKHDCGYSCSACAKYFNSPRNLKLHHRSCSARVKCDICSVTHNKSELHKCRFSCWKCDNNFPGRVELDEHMAQCTSTCSSCNKTFTSLHSRKIHVCRKPVVRCRRCNQEFPSRYFLNLHIRDVHLQRGAALHWIVNLKSTSKAQSQ